MFDSIKKIFGIKTTDYSQLMAEGAIIIDVRSSGEFASGHIKGSINIPVIDVHISNILAREEYSKTSFIASKCVVSISGLGLESYLLALQYFKIKLNH